MLLPPLLRAHGFMRTEAPPEVWEAADVTVQKCARYVPHHPMEDREQREGDNPDAHAASGSQE
jgi:hypothetical protein